MTPLLAPQLRRDPQRSFESVYRKHVRDVYGFSLSILGNAQDAEDVTQITFLNAYRALERGERVQNFRAWLLAIAHNVCRQRFRSAARRPQEVELGPEVAEAFSDEDVPSAQEIRDAMAKLAFNQRSVLVLREIEGLSYEEIAETMDLSLSAVETLLFRARRALREQLEAAESDLGCDAVQRLISLQLDGKLSRPDRRLLRAHLRGCEDCARFARSQRARKRAMPGLVAVPLPASLTSGLQSGGVGFFAAKAAALAASAALIGTGALVQTGVIPVPGNSDGDRAKAVVEAAAGRDEVSALAATRGVLELRSEVGQAARTRETRLADREGTRKTRDGKRQKPSQASGGGAVAAASGGGSEAVGGSAGGGTAQGGADALGGATAAVGGAVDTVGGTVGTAGGAVGGAVGGATDAVGGAVGGATDAVGGAVGGATETVGGAVGGATDTVGGAVGGAQDKLPPPPVSPTVETPSLPPVTLTGTGSLP